jgi:hypothetical protein
VSLLIDILGVHQLLKRPDESDGAQVLGATDSAANPQS